MNICYICLCLPRKVTEVSGKWGNVDAKKNSINSGFHSSILSLPGLKAAGLALCLRKKREAGVRGIQQLNMDAGQKS